MDGTVFVAVFTLFCLTAVAQITDKQWQAKAVEKYPALGIQGSDLNKRFLSTYSVRQKTNPAFFTDPKWPLLLADEIASHSPSVELPAISSATRSKPIEATPHSVNSGTRPVSGSQSNGPATARTTTPQSEVKESSATGRALPIAAVGIVGLVIWSFTASAANRRKHRARLYAEAREYIDRVKSEHALPTVDAPVILKSGENAFYSASSALYETRAVRHHQSGFTGFRVAKGIYIGGSRGRSTSSQEWSKIDSGMLIVTNKRLIFDGGSADRSVALTKILSADSSIDGVEVSVENRQKSMVFAAANPLILSTIIRICCQVDNPLDLSQTPLEITFVE